QQPSTEKMAAISQGLPTTSAKIRALGAAGFSRTDIARFLGKRYQHVRNVLVQEDEKSRSADAPVQSASLEVSAGGRIVIPAAFRNAMGIEEGDRLVARLVDGELRLLSKQAALRQAQDLVSKFVRPGTSLADELMTDRKLEAKKEASKK
ncbi:MAG: AbrB/MazE/SpoVT family DNA-binding domain-containing protein, partial [Parvibaculum sp.]